MERRNGGQQFNSRGGENLGALDFEGANSELEQLEPLGSGFGLEIGSLGRVDGQDPSPGGGRDTRFLRGDRDEIRVHDLVSDVSKGKREVGLAHLLHCS